MTKLMRNQVVPFVARMTVLGTLATAPATLAQQPPTTAPAAHPAPAASAAEPAANFGDRYAILADKNIFVRNRPATRTPGAQRSVARRAEETMVLTGIALQEGRHVAFLEDSAARSTKRLVPGDQVAGGTIAAVNFDSMEFDANGKRIHIAVGRNLLGEIAPVAAAPVESSSSQPAVASAGSSGRSASNERDRNSRDGRSSRNGSSNNNGNSRDRERDRGRDSSREIRTFSASSMTPQPRDGRERDPAAPAPAPEGTITVAPGSPASPALPNDPNMSIEERMRLRAQQLRGENK